MRFLLRSAMTASLVTFAAVLLPPPSLAAQTVTATRTDQPIVLDGRDDDPVWRTAPAQGDFRESRPSEGAEPKQRTEFRVAYDPNNLYVFVRAFDTHPDSIIRLLSRRDEQTASDQIIVMIDAYQDRRTGYAWYTYSPVLALRQYENWAQRNPAPASNGSE